MKKRLLPSLVLVLFCISVHARGDVGDESLSLVNKSVFYLGTGLGQGSVSNAPFKEEVKSSTVLLQAGYEHNRYLALEGRYSFGFDIAYTPGIVQHTATSYHGDFSAWGIYIKPIYPIGDFSLYALIGYGGVRLTKLPLGDGSEQGFQWGFGASYTFEEKIMVFADYVHLYQGDGFDHGVRFEDIEADVWNIGVSYKF